MRAGAASATGDARAAEARLAALRADPQLMEAASRLVAEVLERAKEEALRRLRQDKADGAVVAGQTGDGAARGGDGSHGGSRRNRERWGSRAQGFLVRFFASLCLCNSNGTGASKSS